MKKIIVACILFLLAVPAAYFALDYAFFLLKPRHALKKILIVSEKIEPGSTRARLVAVLENVLNSTPNISSSVADVSTLGFSFLTADDAPAQKPLSDPSVQRWRTLVTDADGIIFLVPNYYHGYSAGIKNSIDMLWKEWHNKPTAVMGYSGLRADGTIMLNSFKRVLDKIKSDPVSTMVYVSPDEIKNLAQQDTISQIESRMRTVVAQLYAGTEERNYSKQLYRSVTDKLLRALIKFFKKKH